MSGDLQTMYGQLYNETQLSLHRYHQSIVNLLNAVRKRKANDQRLNSNMIKTSIDIKDSILNIQTIQQKKFQMKPGSEPFRNMVCYRINLLYGLPKIYIEEDTPHPPWKPIL